MKTNGFIFFFFVCNNCFNVIVESRSVLNSEPGVISNEIVNAIQQKQKTEFEQNSRLPRQDDEDGGSNSGTEQSVGLQVASAASSSTAELVAPNSAIGQIIQNIVPDAQGAVVSILKAVSSPFDFISKSVDNYINPTVPPTTEAPKRSSEQNNQYGTVLESGNSDITVLLLPDAIKPISVPISMSQIFIPKPKTPPKASTTSEAAEEEDEEGSNSDD